MEIYYSSGLTKIARKLRNSPTRAEKVLWNTLKNRALGYDFHRQKPISNFIYDFYCHKLRLIIEVDGITHEDPEVQANDRQKDLKARQIGFRMLRLTDDDVLQRGDYAENRIREVIREIEAEHTPRPPLDRGGERKKRDKFADEYPT